MWSELVRIGRGWRGAALGAMLLGALVARAAAPVSFRFEPATATTEPFARELWAEVSVPGGRVLRLPAFYVGDGRFEVRARAERRGVYRVGRWLETKDGATLEIAGRRVGRAQKRVRTATERLPVRTEAPADGPAKFVFADGSPYVPLGMNLAWAPAGDRAAWYERALGELEKNGLTWTRIWMASWGGLNLDWLPEDMGASPPRGQLDLRVAATWDRIVAAAERDGVYVQWVLQHHGQVSSRVNPNWAENPWNAANPGGFLRTPAEFFTSEEARRLTRQKYRYIVARWGYSPAVLAWELFNEVHWVDAVRIDHREDLVARWHAEMAAYLRSVDVYRHLVTTSTDNVRSPVYAAVDYVQPHLYATAMLAAVRRFDAAPAELEKPIFYGEIGDDHMRLSAAQKAAGVELAPIAWASVMGEGRYPAQIWEGAKLLEQGRVRELRALGEFLRATQLPLREGLRAFSAAVADAPRARLVLEGAENWHLRAPAEFTVRTDGRQELSYGVFPRIFVGAPESVAAGYSDRATVHIEYPRAATARLKIAQVARPGATVRVRVDGEVAVEKDWPALPKNAADEPRGAELSFAVGAGPHTIVVDNPGKKDWFELDELDFGLEAPVLATVGRRGADFVALWVWDRDGVFALRPPKPVTGAVVIDDLPAGRWRVTWWNSVEGRPGQTTVVRHDGGELRLATPLVARHAAVVLNREGEKR